jgi:hypothetical protein
LRRFAAEAAREDARMFCNELVSDDADDPLYYNQPSNDEHFDDARFAA